MIANICSNGERVRIVAGYSLVITSLLASLCLAQSADKVTSLVTAQSGQPAADQQQLTSKQSAQASLQSQNLKKFRRLLNAHQQDLVDRNEGSIMAVARAVKMTIRECQYQMRNELWDCPIYDFSVSPRETFGMLMSRSFKETSFVQSLLSAAITHSVARACTETSIKTCSRKHLPLGKGFGEDVEFGLQFARDFMAVTHDLQQQQQQQQSQQQQSDYSSNNIIDSSNKLNSIAMSNSVSTGAGLIEPQQYQLKIKSSASSSSYKEPIWKEKRLRQMINAHNEEVGRLIVLNNMGRECKCHGMSGSCTVNSCWNKLPSFRDVGNKLHDSLDQALRVEMYVAPYQGSSGGFTTNRYKSLTSGITKKSNKKRSSSLQQSSANLLSGLGRSSATLETIFNAGPALMRAEPTSINKGGAIVGRLQAQQELNMNSIGTESGVGAQVGSGGNSGIDAGLNINDSGGNDRQLSREREFSVQLNTVQYPNTLTSLHSHEGNTTFIKKKPIARSIGPTASTITISKSDLIYAEESLNYCSPIPRYNVKGTKGRICSEDPKAADNCETLCCKRGYKTEKREEKYSCDCKFHYCCVLKCNTCTRRKVTHKCL